MTWMRICTHTYTHTQPNQLVNVQSQSSSQVYKYTYMWKSFKRSFGTLRLWLFHFYTFSGSLTSSLCPHLMQILEVISPFCPFYSPCFGLAFWWLMLYNSSCNKVKHEKLSIFIVYVNGTRPKVRTFRFWRNFCIFYHRARSNEAVLLRIYAHTNTKQHI